ncbi:hypothetical protein J2741_001581 [Methanolinea mesophila]|nr:hypothetical protein [Methanolinea mesophila]MBP1929034.1 hypothetical protein [Methanolinea mesophila]
MTRPPNRERGPMPEPCPYCDPDPERILVSEDSIGMVFTGDD